MTEKFEIIQKPDPTWKTQEDMCEIYNVDKSRISRHIKTIFDEGILERESTVALYASVRFEGGREVTRQIEYYSPEVVARVGFRVKSGKGAELQKVSDERTIKDIQKIGENLQQQESMQPVETIAGKIKSLEITIQEQSNKIIKLEETIAKQKVSHDNMMKHLTISYEQSQYLQELGRERVVHLLGGKDTPEYKKDGRKYFKRLWIDFNQHYNINTYKNLNPTNYDKSKEYIQYWTYN